MLKSVGAETSGEHLTLVCLHWKSFPPITALRQKDIEEQRRDNEVTIAEYQQHLVWQRICGLLGMNKKKCRYCPHVRYLKKKGELWVLETPDGSMSSPIVDTTTLESLLRYKDTRPEAEKAAKTPGKKTYTEERGK